MEYRRSSVHYETPLLQSVENVETVVQHNIDGTNESLLSNTRQQWLVLVAMAYSQFWIAACVSLQAPFFPMEAEMKGATPTEYGFVFGIFELVMVVMSPVFGKMVVRTKPKFLVTSGVFISGSACVLFGFLDHSPNGAPFIFLAFAIRIVEGFGSAAFVTACFTVIAAEFPARVATVFSLLETCFGFGLIVGPTIGGGLYQASGFLLPFAVLGAFLILGAVVSFFFLPDMENMNNKETGNMRTFLCDIGILMNALAIIDSLLFIGFNAATLEPHLRQFDLSPVAVGTIFIITGAIYAITTPLWGWLCDKGVDTNFLCIGGYVLSITGLLLIGPIPWIPFGTHLWLVVVSLITLGLGLSSKLVCSFISALRDTLKRGYPNDITTHGMVSAMFASSCSIGAFIGPSMGGSLLQYIGYKHATVVLLGEEALLLTALISYMIWKKWKKLPEEEVNNTPIETTPLLKSTSSPQSKSIP